MLEGAKHAVKVSRKKKPCPHCHSDCVYKRGVKKLIQNYQCRACNKWYSETTGTALLRIQKKEKWQSYLRLMEQGESIKSIDKLLGISIQTSFDWRHKILSSLAMLEPTVLSGVIESDELELSLNQKGDRNLQRKPRKRSSDFKRNTSEAVSVVQVVTAIERSTGKKYLKAVESKRLSEQQISKVFEDKITEGSTLITDKNPSYKPFSKGKEFKHKTVKSTDHVDPTNPNIHLQKVNNTHVQLRKFLTPFNGVSSKYLQNYLNWFAYREQISNSKTVIKQWMITFLLSESAYNLFSLFKNNEVLIRT